MTETTTYYNSPTGILEIKGTDDFISSILFKDDSTIHFWNANRWYAWMDQGTMKFSNGKELTWYHNTPSYETLYKYKKIVKKFDKQKMIEHYNIDEYLPIKVLRKRKLKNLK